MASKTVNYRLVCYGREHLTSAMMELDHPPGLVAHVAYFEPVAAKTVCVVAYTSHVMSAMRGREHALPRLTLRFTVRYGPDGTIVHNGASLDCEIDSVTTPSKRSIGLCRRCVQG